MASGSEDDWLGALELCLIANVPSGIPLFVWTLLTVAMLCHRLVWPLLDRPLYALQRFGIFKHRVFVGSLGVTVCAVSLNLLGAPPWVSDLFKPIEKLFG
jgi:hypothetical protein